MVNFNRGSHPLIHSHSEEFNFSEKRSVSEKEGVQANNSYFGKVKNFFSSSFLDNGSTKVTLRRWTSERPKESDPLMLGIKQARAELNLADAELSKAKEMLSKAERALADIERFKVQSAICLAKTWVLPQDPQKPQKPQQQSPKPLSLLPDQAQTFENHFKAHSPLLRQVIAEREAKESGLEQAQSTDLSSSPDIFSSKEAAQSFDKKIVDYKKCFAEENLKDLTFKELDKKIESEADALFQHLKVAVEIFKEKPAEKKRVVQIAAKFVTLVREVRQNMAGIAQNPNISEAIRPKEANVLEARKSVEEAQEKVKKALEGFSKIVNA